MIQSLNINIDLSIYESQLRGEIGSDMSSLHIIYEAISSPDFNGKKYILKQGITISEVSVPPVEFLKRREINKCFKSIMGSFQDYMDKLIAILRLMAENITMTPPFTEEVIRKFFMEKFQSHLNDVSIDRSLNIPTKLNLILDKIEQNVYKETIQSYFDLRNGLEHHKGIAKSDRVIRYKRIGLSSTAGYEVEKPGLVGEGEGLLLKTFDEEISYDKGGSMVIAKEQLENIVLNLLIFVIPSIQLAIDEKIRRSH